MISSNELFLRMLISTLDGIALGKFSSNIKAFKE